MKKLTLSIFFIGFLATAQAQKKENLYFLKNNGTYTKVRDSADYVRVIQEPDSGEVNYKLIEYYLNGKIKAAGTVSNYYPYLIYEGQCVFFDKNGIKQSMDFFKKNEKVNKSYYFFPNGKIHKIIDYDGFKLDRSEKGELMKSQPFKMEYFADSMGNVLIDDGNGHFKEIRKSDTSEVIEEGDYIGGVKDGLWSETSTSGDTWYKENFMKGKLLSGESFKNGQRYLYAVESEPPTFKGGMNEFYRYLLRSVRYPEEAREHSIVGTVYLNFMINVDGSITDIVVVGQVCPSIDQEAVRVLSLSPNWIPAKQHGIPVREKYHIPMTFSISVNHF